MTLDELRSVLHQALGDTRLEGVDPVEPLLRTGLITSLEVVMVTVALERHFKVKLPTTGASSWTLSSLLEAIGGKAVSGASPAPARRLPNPALALAAVLLAFAAINLLTDTAFRTVLREPYQAFLEHGKRFYPYAGDFAMDDFRFAAQFHEIQQPAAPGQKTVLVCGDSGTVGSFVPAEQAIPAQTETLMRAQGSNVRVMNLAWFGRLLVKDVMLLDTVWDKQFDVVVLTISDDYFNPLMADQWIRAFPHCNFNTPLFREFVSRVEPEDRPAFLPLLNQLEAADAEHGGAIRHALFSANHLSHYAPYFGYLYYVKATPPIIGTLSSRGISYIRSTRCAFGNPALHDYHYGLTRDQFDAKYVRLLRALIHVLHRRGVKTVLYLEPKGPIEWREAQPCGVTAQEIAANLASETGCQVVDCSWDLTRGNFLDSSAHYTVEGNRKIAERLAPALMEDMK